MSRQTNSNPMTDAEMALAAKAQTESRVYQYGGKAQTADINREIISGIVDGMKIQMEAATDPARRFPLTDEKRLNSVTKAYLEACASAGALPTVTGLAAACGRTRDSLYKFADTHEDFREWLENFSSMAGEAMGAAAIHGATAAIPSIFILKSRFGFKDVVSVEQVQPKSALGSTVDPDTIAARYAELPED